MLIGHQRILEFLKKSIKNNRLAHAYLFTGPAHLGKRTVALEFIRMLNGQEIEQTVHPDILIIEPVIAEKEGIKKELEISIDQAREIQRQMSLYPYRAPYKITLIDQAEKMSREAGNCLLKTLEEPTGRAVMILITANPQLILLTIVSRCQLIKFLPVAEEEIEKGIKVILKEVAIKRPTEESGGMSAIRSFGLRPQDDNLKQVVRLANGRPGLAIQYLENPAILEEQNKIIKQLEKLLQADLNQRYQYAEKIAKDVPQSRQTLAYWLFWFRDLLLLSIDCPQLTIYPDISSYKNCYSLNKIKKIIQSIKKTDWLLANPSINARLALEVLMLEF